MEYNKLVAVTGLPGLYELISSKKDGAIVRSLEDKTTRFASSRIHQFSHLESIEIYTIGDNVNLVDIFQAMSKDGTALPDIKDDKAVKTYFQKVYPDMDFDRVYTSDMKKMIKWLAVLQKNNIEIKLTEPLPEEPGEVIEAEAPAAVETTEPAIKEAKKKAPAKKKAKEPAAEAASKAPRKKAAAKKKAEE